MRRSEENHVNCDEQLVKEQNTMENGVEEQTMESEKNPKVKVTSPEVPTTVINGDKEEICTASLVESQNGSDSNEEVSPNRLTASISPPERKPSRNLQEIDKTLEELHELAEDAYMTAKLAQGNSNLNFEKLFEKSNVYLKKCETVPEDLSKQQFSDEDGILEEIEEAVRDAEEKQYEPNHVGVVLDTECSSDDDGGVSASYPAPGRLDLRSRLTESKDSLRNVNARVRQRVSSNANLNDRRSIISGHERARSNDSRATSFFSSSIASFRRPISHFSIDNSCFDVNEAPTQRSLMCTPIEKMYVKNSRSAPEMRVHETKINPFLPSPSPSNEATTTSDPSVSSELSAEQSLIPLMGNLKLRLNEGLTETPSPVSSPMVKPKKRKETKTSKQMLKSSASSPNMNSQIIKSSVEVTHDKPSNRTFEVVYVNILQVNLIRKPKKSVYIMAKFDGRDVHRSSKLKSDNLVHDFSVETTDTFSNLHIVFLEGSKAKVARPVGKVSICRNELEVGTPLEQTLKLCAVSKYPDFCGQICIEIKRQPGMFSLRVVDCGGLKLKENPTLLLLVSTIGNSSEVGKLSIDAEEKRSKEWLEMPCAEGMLSLKLTLWQDLLKGVNSVFHGQVRVDVDDHWKSGPAKWFYLRSKANEEGESSEESGDIGEVTVRATFQIDHILRMHVYKPLLDLLFLSGDESQPLTASLVAVIEALPKVELGPVSRSLVELMAQSERIRPVLNSLYVNSILKCQDENTLFRGQSLSGKMLFEILTTFGKMYLITTLKPVVDKIYKERKNCEVDPSRVLMGTSLEKNKSNLLMYFQMLFERVTTSSANCPHIIKQFLFDLRNVVGNHHLFSARPGIQRLAVSSFVIMRFFAAAILNPKAFEVRKDQPELRVSRTLLLLSKLLQRLSNCSVSEGPLSSKEPWLDGVFETVTSDTHKTMMASFLDNISLVGEKDEPQRCTVFKFGNLQQVDRSRLGWKKMLHYKKRYVQLTETEFIWQKDVQCPPKGTIALSDVKTVTVDHKNIITIATETSQMQFEAPGGVEANDWSTAIERQRNRVVHGSEDGPSELFFFDAERHIDKIHNLLYKYRDTMIEWRDQLQSGAELDEKTAPELLKAGYVLESERQKHKESLIATLCNTIDVTDAIQIAHDEYEKENLSKIKMEETPSCR